MYPSCGASGCVPGSETGCAGEEVELSGRVVKLHACLGRETDIGVHLVMAVRSRNWRRRRPLVQIKQSIQRVAELDTEPVRIAVGEVLLAGNRVQNDWMLDDGFDEPFKRAGGGGRHKK